MAAANLTRPATHEYNQKKTYSVSVAEGLVESDILVDGSIVFVLPEKVILTNIYVNVTTVSATASATVDVLVGSDVVANEVAVTTAGLIAGTVANHQQATGGEVTIKSGATAPAAGDLVCDLILEYIEYDKNNGDYTLEYAT
jgi:hypothetical protein